MEGKIYQHLKSGKSLTVLSALKLFGTTELRTYLSRINKYIHKHGLTITRDKVTEQGKKFNRYSFTKTK